MNSPLRIAIIDDSRPFIRTLKTVLESDAELQCVDSWSSPIKFLGELAGLSADVVLLDVDMPKVSGVECVIEIKRLHPKTAVLMLTVVDDDEVIFKAIENGADGYLLKSASPSQLIQAIKDAATGGAPMTASIARRVLKAFKAGRSSDIPSQSTPSPDTYAVLTFREREVLDGLVEGLKYRELAAKLSVSVDTIKKHTGHIYSKLQVRNRTEATAKVLRS